MKKTLGILLLSVLAAGCAGDKSMSEKSVTRMREGYGVIVATFKYPGKTEFPRSQIFQDAKFACDALAKLSYEPFIVYDGGNVARVGVRASTFALATAYKKDFEKKGKIYLGNGVELPIVEAEISNIAELKIRASDKIP
jgi:hypothetical protein